MSSGDANRRGPTTSAIPWWPSNPARAVSVPPSTSTIGIRRLVAWRTRRSSAWRRCGTTSSRIAGRRAAKASSTGRLPATSSSPSSSSSGRGAIGWRHGGPSDRGREPGGPGRNRSGGRPSGGRRLNGRSNAGRPPLSTPDGRSKRGPGPPGRGARSPGRGPRPGSPGRRSSYRPRSAGHGRPRSIGLGRGSKPRGDSQGRLSRCSGGRDRSKAGGPSAPPGLGAGGRPLGPNRSPPVGRPPGGRSRGRSRSREGPRSVRCGRVSNVPARKPRDGPPLAEERGPRRSPGPAGGRSLGGFGEPADPGWDCGGSDRIPNPSRRGRGTASGSDDRGRFGPSPSTGRG